MDQGQGWIGLGLDLDGVRVGVSAYRSYGDRWNEVNALGQGPSVYALVPRGYGVDQSGGGKPAGRDDLRGLGPGPGYVLVYG